MYTHRNKTYVEVGFDGIAVLAYSYLTITGHSRPLFLMLFINRQ